MGRNKENSFFLLGISHKTAPVEVREKVSFDSSSYSSVLSGIHGISGVKECVLLSTCNRTELYAVITGKPENVRKRLDDYILDISGSGKEILDCFYYLQGNDVIEHLFKVSSGLDSMILGEPQIFGQVKDAYSAACDNKCTGPALNRLFHHAFRVGKLIRSITAVGEGAVSVSFAAVELTKSIFEDLRGRSVLLIGAGKTGELSARRLLDSGVRHLYIANRTAERAGDLADKLGGKTVPFEEINEMFEKTDIIITSVTTREPIINKNGIIPYTTRRKGDRLLLIDLGVPRNVDSDVDDIENILLYNIDELEDLTLENMDKRKNEAEKALEIISGKVGEFSAWLSEREVIPAIRDLHVKCENIRKEELEKIKNRVSPEAFETIDLVTRRIVRKLLHNPVIAIRATESGEKRDRLIKSIQELFNPDYSQKK